MQLSAMKYPENAATKVIQFTRGVPPLEAIPVAALVEQTLAVLNESRDAVFQYAPLGGYLGNSQLREQLGLLHNLEPNHIFIGNGSLQVLDLLAALLLEGKQATVYVEAPTYDRAIQIFERHGAQVIGIPVEADGVDVAELEKNLRTHRAAFFYTIADFQNPSGVTMSHAKRHALIELAARYECWIIEDIPYRALRYRGVAPPMISSLARDANLAHHANIVTVGSLTKVLSPGLRIGYAIGNEDLARSLAFLAEGTYLSPSPLCQAIAARCIEQGVMRSNIARVNARLQPRHDAAVAVVREYLGEVLFAAPDGGYYLSVRVHSPFDEPVLLEKAREAGVMLSSGAGFYPRASRPPKGIQFLRLPFQGLEPDEFARGVQRLASVLHM